MRYLNRLDTITILLIFTNILVFLYEIVKLGTGLLTTRVTGPMDFASIGGINANTPIYSYVTSMFLHGSVTHLIMNMLALVSIGNLIYQQFGAMYYLIGYFVSGILANVLSVIIMPDVTSVGASGAIFGLFGMYVIASLFIGGFQQFSEAAISVGLSLASGIVMPQVNVWAHLGGLIVGLILGLIFMLLKGMKNKMKDFRQSRKSDYDQIRHQQHYF